MHERKKKKKTPGNSSNKNIRSAKVEQLKNVIPSIFVLWVFLWNRLTPTILTSFLFFCFFFFATQRSRWTNNRSIWEFQIARGPSRSFNIFTRELASIRMERFFPNIGDPPQRWSCPFDGKILSSSSLLTFMVVLTRILNY